MCQKICQQIVRLRPQCDEVPFWSLCDGDTCYSIIAISSIRATVIDLTVWKSRIVMSRKHVGLLSTRVTSFT